MWNEPRFRKLSKDCIFIYLSIMTHPLMTSMGCMRGSIPGLAAEASSWFQPEGYRDAFLEAMREGLIEHDEKACFIALPMFFEWNRPESLNVIKSWEKLLDTLPRCDLQTAHFQRVTDYVSSLGDAYREALPDAIGKACRIQKTENRKQKTEKKKEDSMSGTARGASRTGVPSSDPSDPVFLEYPCKGKPSAWSLHESKIREWVEAFPGLDVRAECRKARQWVIDVPTRQKTARGMTRFLNGWLGRSNDRGGSVRQFPNRQQSNQPKGLDISDIPDALQKL